MMKIFNSILLILFLNSFLLPDLLAQTTRYAGTYNELSTAITASANSGDIIQISADIVVTAQLTISKSLTIYGNGYTLTVPVPGLDEMGRFNSSASMFRVFTFSGGTTTVNNLTIKGGLASGGGAVYINSTSAVLTLNNCIISNSRSSSGGGGIQNLGVLYLNDCYIRRNAANYGGGLLNDGLNSTTIPATVYLQSCTMVENRSTDSNGGGGAVENKGKGKMFFNNSTLSNNQSNVTGGAINNYNSTVYFINSSATGNVVYGASNYGGGVMDNLNSDAKFYCVNSLFAYNYRVSGTTEAKNYVLNDVIGYFSGNEAGIYLYNCVHHANLPAGIGASISNIQYTGLMDGSNNTIFTDGVMAKITDANGTEIGDPIYRPFLYNNEGSVTPTLQNGSFVLQAANRGTRTRYANNNNVNPVVAYYNGSAYVNLAGTSASGQEVLFDQVGDARPDPPARGAIEGVVSDLYMVKVLVSASGTVNGGTFYGDVYPAGTSVTLTAIPNSGYEFTRYDYVLGGSGTASTSNPYTFTVNSDITLQPVFTALPANNYTVTYVGNGNTGGTAPSDVTFSGSTVLSGAGTLVKTGYSFNGWNTSAYGSGTAYAAGATYSAAANLTLYAKWSQATTWNWTGASSTAWGTAGNWSRSDQATATVPTAADNVSIQGTNNDPLVASGVGASCNNLIVNSGAILTIQSGGSLITNGSITNNGTIDIQRTITKDRWHLISSPITNATALLFEDDYLQTWSEPIAAWTDIVSTGTSLSPAKGYSLWTMYATDHTYTFSGTPNTGDISTSLTAQGTGNLYNRANLLGNPYPSAIDWSMLDNTYGAVYYWQGNGTDGDGTYLSWLNGTGPVNGQYIAPMQGFFVVAASAGTFSLTNANRTHTMGSFYKSSDDTRDNLLVLETVSKGISDKLYLKLDPFAEEGFELSNDAYKFFANSDGISQLYSLSGDNKLSIDVRPVCDVVELGFTNTQAGDYQIGLSEINGFDEAMLEDAHTGTFTDLLNKTYTFSYVPGEQEQRFKLHFNTILSNADKKDITSNIYSYRKTTYINMMNGVKGDIYIYNVAGQLVATKLSAKGMNEIGLKNTGIYIVKVVTDKSSQMKKIFIR